MDDLVSVVTGYINAAASIGQTPNSLRTMI